MSGDLSDPDMKRVLALITEYEEQGIVLDVDFAVKNFNNPDGIRSALIAEKPVIDNTQKRLTEKHNKQANRVLEMLPNNIRDKDKVLRIVSQNTGTDEQLANMCFERFIEKSTVATAKPANNNCVAAGTSSIQNSGWRCTNCTYQNFQDNNECDVCGELKQSSTELNNNNSMSDNQLCFASVFNTGNRASIENMSWICTTCTYENPQNVQVCEMCDEHKTLEEEEEDDQQLNDTEMQLLNATNLTTRLRELHLRIDSIEDLIPFVIQHKDLSLEEMVEIYISRDCDVEVSAEPVGNCISSNKNVGWECSTCTLLNEENASVCISCETNRENEVWTCICTTENSIIRNTCIVCENTKE